MLKSEYLVQIYDTLVQPKQFGDSLTNIAKNRKKIVLTCSELAVDFDKFKMDIVQRLALPEPPNSCDALYLSKRNVPFWVLIEFKSGKIKNTKDRNLKEKICDSLLLLLSEFELSFSFLRDNCMFLFVYCPEENPQEVMGTHLAQRAGLPSSLVSNIKRRLERFYFKEVLTYTINEFDSEFRKNFS
jgi:hypothetical protein